MCLFVFTPFSGIFKIPMGVMDGLFYLSQMQCLSCQSILFILQLYNSVEQHCKVDVSV